VFQILLMRGGETGTNARQKIKPNMNQRLRSQVSTDTNMSKKQDKSKLNEEQNKSSEERGHCRPAKFNSNSKERSNQGKKEKQKRKDKLPKLSEN